MTGNGSNISDPLAFKRWREYGDMIKLEHTIFALPFALTGTIVAANGWPGWAVLFWVVLAMSGGRTFAMALNRLIDAELDARNPRTRGRAIPAGRVQPWEALALAGGALVLMAWATWQLPLICRQLWPLAILILAAYSYTKRFTWLSHLVLGLALGAGAAGGWLAVTGSFAPGTFILAGAVILWVAGFDIIYACQDEQFDRAEGLHSVPARLGLARGLKLSAALHAVTVVLLVLFGWIQSLGWIFAAGVAAAAGMLWYEHRLVSPTDLTRVDQAFFAINGWVSVGLFACTLLDRTRPQWGF